MSSCAALASPDAVTAPRRASRRPREVEAARRALKAAADWPTARRWSGRPPVDVACHVDGRPLTRTAAAIFAMVRQAPVCRFSGVNVTLDALAYKFAKGRTLVRLEGEPDEAWKARLARRDASGRRKVCCALDELGPHRVACVGHCQRPGFERRTDDKPARPLCLGCASPCPRSCTKHADLVRRVYQFTEERWTCEATGRTFQRRQMASVLVLGSAARNATRPRPRLTCIPGVSNVTPNTHPLSLRDRGGEEERETRGKESPAATRSKEPTTLGIALAAALAAPADPPGPVSREPERSRAATSAAPEGVGLEADAEALWQRYQVARAATSPTAPAVTAPPPRPRSDAPEDVALVAEVPPEVARFLPSPPLKRSGSLRAALELAKACGCPECRPPAPAPEDEAAAQWAALFGGAP